MTTSCAAGSATPCSSLRSSRRISLRSSSWTIAVSTSCRDPLGRQRLRRVAMSNLHADPAGEVTRHLRELEARGSHGLVAQLIDSLMGESSGQMEAVRNAAASGDREALYRAAHSLQGSVAVVGADSVARACAQLVKTARSGSFDQILRIVAELESGLEAIRKALVGWTDAVAEGAGAAVPRGQPAQD